MGKKTQTVWIGHEGTLDSALDAGAKLYANGGPVTFLGMKGYIHVRNSSSGGSGYITIQIQEATPTGPISTVTYLEGIDQHKVIWSLPVRVNASSGGYSDFMVPIDIKTRRVMREGEKFWIVDDGSSDNAAAYKLCGKCTFLTERGGFIEATQVV